TTTARVTRPRSDAQPPARTKRTNAGPASRAPVTTSSPPTTAATETTSNAALGSVRAPAGSDAAKCSDDFENPAPPIMKTAHAISTSSAPPTRLLGHAGAEEEQRTGPLDEAVPGERHALAKPRSVPACVVLDQRAQLVAVPGAPRGRVPPERIAPRAGHDAAPSARRRAAPTRDSVRISSTTADSASDPAAVIRYGRRRSSAGSGSMRPRSSSRVIAPYSAPGPSDTPANASMSLASA